MKKYKHESKLPFVRLAKKMLFSDPDFWKLSTGARDVYLLLKGKFNGSNNGEIRLYYREILDKKIDGLRSANRISAAFRELEEAGWIKRKRIGGLHRCKNDYEITGKFDPAI